MQAGSTKHNEGWGDDAVLPAAVIIAQAASGRAEANGVVVGKRFATERRQSTCIRSAEEGSLYMWSGYHLQLRKAQAEAYYLNIRGDSPSVFVVGRNGADGFVPERLTVSLDEAQNLDATELRDAGETVMRVAMPAEVYRWVEGFVLKHYEPRRKGGKGRGKKRSKALYDAEVGDQADTGGQT
ncbi:Protein of unknown function [Aquisalimonas asiatica]|uniref:DUF3305 domain-containing protein n=1 Tax=Aquisalimonas asiatica TaxID=406100 RepID=A0A1H8RKW0_9GAMM|nr:Protein of unknown function [Aquisalimonas asiatica]